MVASTAVLKTPKFSQNKNQAAAPQYGFGKIIMWTILFQLAWSWGSLKMIITQGLMQGPDDFMRLYQVRSFLSGQAWFDTTAYRMLQPAGADIHWSRLVDVPIAGLIYFFNLMFDQQMAERITTIVWPTILLVATVLVITKICDSLFSNYNRLLPVFFTVLCISSLAQFVPGRIDHHNVQILLYAGILWCLVNWEKPTANILAGIIIPFSISIGLDVFIFFILFMAWFGMEWVLGSDQKGVALRRFSLVLAIATLVFYPINIAPANWFDVYCDANSIVFFTAQMLIAGSMLVMSYVSPFLSSEVSSRKISSRLGLATVLAGLSVVALLAMYPLCLGGPFAAVSDELNTRWLSQVTEAKNIFSVLADNPQHWIKTVAYSALFFVTAIWVLRHNLENKSRLMMIFAVFLASVLLSVIQYRTIRIGFFAAIPLSVLATELVARKLIDKFGQGSIISVAGQIASVILLSTASWSLAGNLIFAKPAQASFSTDEAASIDADAFRKTCFRESDYKLLASLPIGQVMSWLNSAPAILIFTDKSVVSGPYHRNQRGILDVMDFYRTNADNARKIATRHKVDYVTLCTFKRSAKKIADSKKATLESRLYAGDVPNWLERLSVEGDKMLVFRVKN